MVTKNIGAREAVESMYEGLCTIINTEEVVDGNIDDFVDVTICENQPCRVSYKNIPVTDNGEYAGNVVLSIKLFIAPELDIKAGSKIVVVQHGKTETYESSGKAALYDTHQEIELKNERYA